MASPAGLAEILRAFGPAYLATHTLSPGAAKAWRAILACRTAALGGHIEACEQCGATRPLYHSCRNRHCPKCQTRAKEAWLLARQRELLPVRPADSALPKASGAGGGAMVRFPQAGAFGANVSAHHFHLVFTLPHALNRLIAQHPRPLYECLFAAVSGTLGEFAANPHWLGGESALTLVLHTWKQDLARHVHLHALVAGGALTRAGEWVTPKRGFLFPVKALSSVFRGKFVAALETARSNAQLQEDAALTDTAWRQLKRECYRHNWVVYAKIFGRRGAGAGLSGAVYPSSGDLE